MLTPSAAKSLPPSVMLSAFVLYSTQTIGRASTVMPTADGIARNMIVLIATPIFLFTSFLFFVSKLPAILGRIADAIADAIAIGILESPTASVS